MLMLPVPENRSSAVASSRSILLARILNRLSLAKSVVGRALNVLGTSHRLCLYIPLITLKELFPVTGVVIYLHAGITAAIVTILKKVYDFLLIKTTVIAVLTKICHKRSVCIE